MFDIIWFVALLRHYLPHRRDHIYVTPITNHFVGHVMLLSLFLTELNVL